MIEENINEEGQEYGREETEEKDVEVMEFSLMDEEIEELIAKLQLLKGTKEPIQFEVDDENELLINYEESAGAPLGVPQSTEFGGKDDSEE
ncbi:MAG: hypothetical protein KJ721_01260, partial [Nanoarchaeota archaeon]|nr:hypothetical protein [Nanoarchaeota archaeon]